MTFRGISEVNPNYRDQFEGNDIRGFGVYSDLVAGVMSDTTEEKFGTVYEVLVDDAGKLQYVVVNLGSESFPRPVLLPFERSRIDYKKSRVYASGYTKEQIEQLPELTKNT
jgi:hypothetical protein